MDARVAQLYAEAFMARAPRADDVGKLRLVVTDDSGYARLTEAVAAARSGTVSVFEEAVRCNDLMRSQARWSVDRPTTAMVLEDVPVAPRPRFPDGLVLRAVRRRASDPAGGVPLEHAVAVAIASDPGIKDTPQAFARFLAELPPSVLLLAAVDEAGEVRATAGCDVFGELASIFFVNTEPAWRRRGIGGAMTLASVRAGAEAGARRAFLHASADGAPVYARLGFVAAGRVTLYRRPG